MVLTDTTTSPVWPNAGQSNDPNVDGIGEGAGDDVESSDGEGIDENGTQVEESSHTFAATSGLERSRQANHAWLVRRSEQQTVWSYFVVSSSASSSSPILLPS